MKTILVYGVCITHTIAFFLGAWYGADQQSHRMPSKIVIAPEAAPVHLGRTECIRACIARDRMLKIEPSKGAF